MTQRSARLRLPAMQEALAIWLASFLAILASTLFFRGHAKLIATVCFLYLPLLAMHSRGEDYRDYGVTLRRWREDLKLAALLFDQLLAHLPRSVAGYVWPYALTAHFRPKLPAKFELWVVDQLFVVALPE